MLQQFKIINVLVKEDCHVPEVISTFSPEENFMMLKIGSDCLLEGRKVVAGLTQQEIYKNIKEESKEQIQKLEMDMVVERELKKQIEISITKIFETQIERLTKQLEAARNQLLSYESENKEMVRSDTDRLQMLVSVEVEKTKQHYECIVNEKDKQNQLFREIFERETKLTRESLENVKENVIKLSSNKTSAQKGSDGEKLFQEYAETFIDFKGFDLLDKHTQVGSGDFHLRFEEFDVLVDVKNYKTNVPNKEREKIKNDLLKNQHLTFAWLVSLNTSIDKWDKSPVMYEWINTSQCIVHINNLTSFEDPKKILRIVWFTCKELCRFLVNVSTVEDASELTTLKEKQFKLNDKFKNLRKHIRELNTSMNSSKAIVQLLDDELKEMMGTDTEEIANLSAFESWWESRVELTEEPVMETSTNLWLKFKQEEKTIVNDFHLTPEMFKQFIKSKVSANDIVAKSKSTCFEIKGLKLKTKKRKTEVVDVVVTEVVHSKKNNPFSNFVIEKPTGAAVVDTNK
jgi:hypothetical protein